MRPSDGTTLAEADPYCPSGHTGLLIDTLQHHAGRFGLDLGLDMGVGSGAVLATLGRLGVRRMHGIDIDAGALAATRTLLRQEGLLDRTELHQGSLWTPVAGLRFSIVAANLPQFAASGACDPAHNAYWSAGGPDGRAWMDPFLDGLYRHLLPNGAAFITHNVFLGRDRTRSALARHGLVARAAAATSVPLAAGKAAALNPAARITGFSRVGHYEFMAVEVLEIRHAATLAGLGHWPTGNAALETCGAG